MKTHSFVERIDAPPPIDCGWRLAMPVFDGSPHQQEVFLDFSLGGKNKALNKALERRDEIFAKHGLIVVGPKARAKRRDTDPSVVSGISYTFDRRFNTTELRWTTYWNETPAMQTRRSWSVRQHGFAGALRNAVETRESATGAHLDDEMIVQVALRVWLHARHLGLVMKNE